MLGCGARLGFLANGALVLKLDTLLKLSESTSYDLRAAYVLASLILSVYDDKLIDI